jgi:mannose-1-phosphate guanylyltransferase
MLKPRHTNNEHVRVLLTCAGVGARLRPLTDTIPKCLIPIAGKPLLDYWFDAFERAGVRNILLNTHHLPGPIDAYVARRNAGGFFRAQTTHEPTLLGSAGTITANAEFVPKGDDAEVLIIYSDNLSDIDLTAFLEYHRSHDDPFTMLLFRAQFPEKSGIADLEGSGASGPSRGRIVSFVEKPRQPRSNLANAGVYAMTGQLWHEIASWRAFDIGFDVLPRLVGRMHAVEIAGEVGSYHRDIGTHESLEIACRDAARVFS